jgi:hypothetical protein
MSSEGIFITIYLISFEDLDCFPTIWGSNDHVSPVLIFANLVALLIGIRKRTSIRVIDLKRERVGNSWSISEINPRKALIEG